MIIANFQESSFHSLKKKGVLELAKKIYNPKTKYIVHHFSPHINDLNFKKIFEKNKIYIKHYHCKAIQPIKFIISLYMIFKEIKKNKVQLVRCRLPYIGSLLACIVAKILNIPSVVSLGGNNRLSQELNNTYLYNSKFLSYNIEKIVLNFCDVIITPNYYTKNYVKSIIGEKKSQKCKIIPWINFLPEKKKIEKKSKVDVIMIIGFLNKYKFTHVLFNVIDTLINDKNYKKKILFKFCGDGPLMNKGKKRFKSNVKFLGWRSRTETLQLINSCSMLLIPMSGNVIFEAANFGKPVISSKLEWHSEIIEHKKTGLLVDPHNEKEWIDSIKLFLKKKTLASKMGFALEKKYKKNYSSNIAIKKEFDLYRKLIDKFK